MNIGSTHAISGKFEVQALSTVVLQLAPIAARNMDEVQKNIDVILEWMDKASNAFPGFDLIVAPEFSTQGVGPYSGGTLVDLDGPEVKQYCDKCAELSVWGIFHASVKECQGKKNCNISFMVNDNGEIVHTYRKTNPFIPGDNSCPGVECPVTEGPKGSKIAIITCADGDYPEMWREATYNGANIIVRPTHYPAPWDTGWELTNRAGAYCNQIYVVGSGCVCTNYGASTIGRSMIVNPDGNIITEAPIGIPYMIKADLYPQIIDHMRKEMVTNNFPWSFRHRGASNSETPGVGRPVTDYAAYRADEKEEKTNG